MSIDEYGVTQGLESARRLVPVLVPWRPDGGARDDNWKLVKDASWRGWDRLVLGESPEGPFNRSAALNNAYDMADLGVRLGDVRTGQIDYDVVIVADADSMVSVEQLARAIHTARITDRLTVAHDRWVNVEEHERADFLTGAPLNEARSARRTPTSGPHPRLVYRKTVSSMLVVPVDLWDEVGGFDERFVGWGFEDRAFHRMCERARGGYERIPGPVFHLDHDRPRADVDRVRNAGYRANRELWFKYRRANTIAELETVRWPDGRP